MRRSLQHGFVGAFLLALPSGCAREHCDWTTVDDSVEIDASGSLSGRALDNAALSASASQVLVISTDDPADSGATSVSVTLEDYPTEPGRHPIVARVSVLPEQDADRRLEIDVTGEFDLIHYEEESETNPSDAYTDGGTVTARDIQGSLTLSHGGDTARFEFSIEQSLDESCFRCRGIEGCDF